MRHVFDEFAKILKEGRKADGLTEAEIDKLCEDHKVTLLLWDGAFSTARTIDPTEDDIGLYKQFVHAAVVCHVRIGCNVTHKVHLMWKHVAVQMKQGSGRPRPEDGGLARAASPGRDEQPSPVQDNGRRAECCRVQGAP